MHLLFLLTMAWAQTPPAPEAPATTDEPSQADRDRAAELFDNGSALYDEGAYEAAVVAFRESYRLSGEPALIYNIANALERQGELQEARKELNTYRALAPAEERDRLDRRIAAIDDRIAEQKSVAPAPTGPEPQPVATGPSSSSTGTVETQKQPRWALVIGGAAVAGLGGAGAGISYSNAQNAASGSDEQTYNQQRTINGVSWGAVGVGVTVAVLGFALPKSSPVQATPHGLGVRF